MSSDPSDFLCLLHMTHGNCPQRSHSELDSGKVMQTLPRDKGPALSQQAHMK